MRLRRKCQLVFLAQVGCSALYTASSTSGPRNFCQLRLLHTHCKQLSVHSRVSDTTKTQQLCPRQERATHGLKSVEDIPGPSGLCSIPYLGSVFLYHPFTHHTVERSHLMFRELHRRYGPLVKFRRGPHWSVILFHPDLIHEAQSNEGACPVRPSTPMQDVYTRRTGKKKSISQLHGREWQDLRRPIQQYLLQPANIRLYTPAINQVANDLCTSLDHERRQADDGRVSLSDLMLRFAMESSAVYCINLRLRCLDHTTSSSGLESIADKQICNTTSSGPTKDGRLPHTDQWLASCHRDRTLSDNERTKLMRMIKVFMKCLGEGLYKFPSYTFFRTKLYRDFEEASNYIASVCEQRVKDVMLEIQEQQHQHQHQQQRQQQQQQHRTGHPEAWTHHHTSITSEPGSANLLQFLIADSRTDMNRCASLLAEFFSTATENVSNSLTILLWHLAKYPAAQERLRQEVRKCVTSDEEVTSEELAHMPYLKACLKESHRLVVPTPLGSVRILPKDIVFNGYHVPQGTLIYFGLNALCHSPEYFEDPETYRPSRWLRQGHHPQETARQRQQAIITQPFGFGVRNCLGRRLAENQIYLAVIKIVQQYSLILNDPDQELDVVYKITAKSSKPLDIRFEPLSQDAAATGQS